MPNPISTYLRRHITGPERRENRALTSGLASPSPFLVDAMTAYTTSSGQRVTAEKALGLSPVWAAVSIISEQVGQLPLKVYRRYDDGERDEARQHRSWRLLHDKPNASTPADRFWSAVTAQLLLYGNAFIRKDRSDPFSEVDELHLLEPETVTIEFNPDTGEKKFIHQPRDTRPKRRYGEDRVLHIFGMSLDGIAGLSVIQSNRSSLGTALAREEFEGGFYRRGANLSGVLKHPNKLSPEAAENLKNSFASLYGGSGKAHGTPVLEEGMEFVQIGSPLTDLQFVESTQLTRTDIAVMFKLPPNYLGGSSGDSLTYATMESNQTHFALHSIAPWTNTIAKAVSNDAELLPQGVFEAEFVLEAMMRGTNKERAEYYQLLKDMGVITADEIRSRENMPALTQAQKDELNPPPPPPQVIDGTAVEEPSQDQPALPLRAVQ